MRSTGRLLTRGDREQLGPDPVLLTPLLSEQPTRLVRGDLGPIRVGSSDRSARQRQQEVRALNRQKGTSLERVLDDQERVRCESTCQIGSALVEDEVHCGDSEQFEHGGGPCVALQRHGQVTSQEGEPSLAVDTHSRVPVQPQRGVDLERRSEGAASAVEVAESRPGETVEVKGARPPHVVVGPVEDLERTTQVGAALLESFEAEAQDAGTPHEHSRQ
ncbi:hypothetical protein [Nocardioides exalbidus]|uniref:hypothetical protein n=1 Tax=Nocardioides exalbidus TaxID=402596 RepID=UPI0015873F97|nr:hypothetical protein [Nocardioides exalbidus]